MKGKFDTYVLWPLAKKFQNWIVDRSTARDFTVTHYVTSLKQGKKLRNKLATSINDLYSNQRYTYRVLQTIQMKLILLCVWAEPAVLGSTKTALKFKYEI